MKKESKRPKKSKKFDSEREFSVVLEKIYSEIKVITEGQNGLKDKFGMLFTEFGKQKEEITMTNLKVTGMGSDIRIIKTDIGEIKDTIKTHGTKLTHLEAIK